MSDVIKQARDYLPIEELYTKHLLDKNNVIQSRDVDGMFHPSQFGGCTRKLWYAACMMPPQHRIDAKLRNTFNHGHAVHDWQQEELGHLLANLTERDDELSFDVDFEVSLTHPKHANSTAVELNIAGRADGLIRVRERGEERSRIIYELKTMADASWQKLTKPQTKHIAQASIYAKCFGADVILFQYYNKNSDLNKFFYVEPDPAAWDAAVEQINRVHDALSSGAEVPAEYSMWECKSCGYYYDCKPELR